MTAEQMRKLDREAIDQFGIPGVVLMEQAAMAVTKICLPYFEKKTQGKVLILAGKGNNGGDGFAVGRLLTNEGIQVQIWLMGQPDDLQGDAFLNYNICKEMGISILCQQTHREEELKQFDFIIDALFGTGLKRNVTGMVAAWIQAINRSGLPIISIDIPSGVDADTGKILGYAVKARETVTFGHLKKGLVLFPGAEYAGKVTVSAISIPKAASAKIESNCFTLTKEEAFSLVPLRKQRSNKGTFGKLFILAGSSTMAGAAAFAGRAAYRIGTGAVVCAAPRTITPVLQNLLPEAVQIPLPEEHGFVRKESIFELEEKIKEAKAVVIGPGLGKEKSVAEFAERVLEEISCPMVIDADGLNILAEYPEFWNKVKAPVIITPHPGEMSRLTGREVSDILDNLPEIAIEFAMKWNCIVVLKDARTVIANPEGKVYFNTTGNSALAKAGSGDVLSGAIGGFLAQGLNPYDAAVLGVFLHGLAGEIGSEKNGTASLLAGQIADYMAEALHCVSQKK